MLVGREHLERPDGSLVLASDSDAHLTYFSTKGTCTLHDEFYVPPPTLPGEEPLPGDPDFQWPIGPWDPGEVLPPDGGQIVHPDPGAGPGGNRPRLDLHADDPAAPVVGGAKGAGLHAAVGAHVHPGDAVRLAREGLVLQPLFEFMTNNLGFQLDAADIDLGPLAMGGLTYGVTTVEMAAAYAAFGNEGVYTKPRETTSYSMAGA